MPARNRDSRPPLPGKRPRNQQFSLSLILLIIQSLIGWPCYVIVHVCLQLFMVHLVRECSLILWWGGWAIENFCRQTFLTPPSQAAKTFWTPLNMCENFFDPPPIATCIKSVAEFRSVVKNTKSNTKYFTKSISIHSDYQSVHFW